MTGDTPGTIEVHSEPLSRMGRRRFVETLVGAGFSATMASCLGADDFASADEDEVPIVYAHARDGAGEFVNRKKTVNAEWYDALQAAFDAHDALDVIGLDGVVSTYVDPGTYSEATASIHIDITKESVRDQLTDLVDGVPVEINLIEGDPAGEGADSIEPEHYYDPEEGHDVPGGVPCSEGTGLATLTPAIDDSERTFFATSNHLYGGDEPAPEGEEFYITTEDGRETIGAVKRGYLDEDVVIVEPTGDFVPDDSIYGATPERVGGQFTRDGLADLKADGAEIHKVGAMTGHTTGVISAIDGVTCVYGDPCRDGQIKWGEESDFTDGDSGSVSYHPDPENPDEQVLVCGINNARTWWPGENYIWGVAGYVLEDRHGFTF